MKLYFVRHGESAGNAAGIHQPSTIGLSGLGKKQAKFLAKRSTKLPIDIVLTSDYERAKQTAEVIAKTINKKVIVSELLREIRRPSEIVGRPIDHTEVVKIKQMMKENTHDPQWRYSDEENIYDLKERAKKFLGYIAKFKEKNIFIVTHGDFLRMVILLMLDEKLATHDLYHKIRRFLPMNNTGITICEDDAAGWRLITWNDHTHLG